MPEDTIVTRVQLDGQRQYSAGAKQLAQDTKGIGKAAQETEKTSKASLGATAKGMLGAAAAAGITVKATSALKSSVNTTVDLAKQTATLKRATGLDAKESQAWAVVAKQRGIETRSLQMGMASLSRTLSSAKDPTKGAGAELAKYGLNAQQLMAMPMDKRMGAIADAFKNMPDGIQKAALAQKLFGRSGQQLLPLLNSGSKGLQGQLDMANKLVPGLAGAGTASLKLAAQQRQMQMASMGLKVAVGSALLPLMLALSNVVTPLVTKFAALMGQSKILTYVVLALAAALGGLFVLSKIASMTTALTTAEITHKAASLASAAASKALAAAQWLLNAAMSANPIVLVVAALAALAVGFVVAYNKVTWFHNAVDAMANAAVAAFNWLLGAAQSVFNWIKGNWPLLLGILGGPMGAAAALIITHFDKIKGAATGAFNTIKSAAQTAGSIVSSAVVGAFNAVKSAIQGVIDTVTNLISSIKSIPTDAFNKIKGGGIPFIPGIQHGTTNFPGGPALVGEAGPELVYLPKGANVIPNSLIGQHTAATINVPVYLDTRQIALATGQWYSDQAARKGV